MTPGTATASAGVSFDLGEDHRAVREMVRAGHLGRKSGRGFFDYTAPAAGDGPKAS